MGEQYKKFGKISIWLAIVIFIIRSGLSLGDISELVNNSNMVKLSYTLFGFAGESIGISTVIMASFNVSFWKCKYINKYIAKTPVLHKKYSGTFESSYDNKVRSGELYIKQTFLKVTVTFKTGESFSDSILASIEEIHGVERLVYTYINEPRGELRDRSPLHYGTASLRINKNSLQGDYYNDRKFTGSMKMKSVEDVNDKK